MDLMDRIMQFFNRSTPKLDAQQEESDHALSEARALLQEREEERLREAARMRALDIRVGLPVRRRGRY